MKEQILGLERIDEKWARSKPICYFISPVYVSMAAFITFPKSRNTFQYPLSTRVCKRLSKRLSRVVAFIIDLSVVARKLV